MKRYVLMICLYIESKMYGKLDYHAIIV